MNECSIGLEKFLRRELIEIWRGVWTEEKGVDRERWRKREMRHGGRERKRERQR